MWELLKPAKNREVQKSLDAELYEDVEDSHKRKKCIVLHVCLCLNKNYGA